MEKYKFRGKRVDNGEWVYGFVLETKMSGVFIIGTNAKSKHTRDGMTIKDELWQYEVDPNTVGQYTGLKDKNNVEIYECDIISTDIQRPYLIVEFRDGCFMFNCNDGGKDYYDIMVPILDNSQKIYKYGEIIGNVHENPEIIKEVNNG